MFVVFSGVLILLVALALSLPFWRKDPESIPVGEYADQNQEQMDLSIEREVLAHSLSELDVELAQGRLAPADHARLKATDERRLLQVLDRVEQIEATQPVVRAKSSAARPTTTRSWIGAVTVSAVVVLAASGIYAYLQWQGDRELTAIQPQGGPGAPDPREMLARLEARLRTHPNDLQGQIMAGRSYQALERIPEAKQAWEKAQTYFNGTALSP